MCVHCPEISFPSLKEVLCVILSEEQAWRTVLEPLERTVSVYSNAGVTCQHYDKIVLFFPYQVFSARSEGNFMQPRGKKVLEEHVFQSVSTKVLSKPTHQMSEDLVMVVENLEISWCV